MINPIDDENTIVSQFFLDKTTLEAVEFNNHFDGHQDSRPAAYKLVHCIKECLENFQKEKNPILKFHEELVPIFEKFFSTLSFNYYLAGKTINWESNLINNILNKENDYPLLIPVGFPGHSMQILIEKSNQDKNKCSVTVYNSGAGLYNHAKWPSSETVFQFFSTYDNVPIDDLITLGIWKPFVEKKFSNSIEFYKAFNSLVVNGTLLAPSKERYDYQRRQIKGTCTTKGIMAFFRHYLLKEINGSPMEKLGLYHYLKAKIYSSIGSGHQFDDLIQSDIKDKLIKIKFTLKLLKLAQKDQHLEAMSDLEQFLIKLGEESFVQDAITQKKEKNSYIENFSLLLAYQQRLAYHFLETNSKEYENYEIFVNEHPEVYTDLSFHMINEKVNQEDRIGKLWSYYIHSGKTNLLSKEISILPTYLGMHPNAAENWLRDKIEHVKKFMGMNYGKETLLFLQKLPEKLKIFENADTKIHGNIFRKIKTQ